jgi:hypothetical protein
MDSLITAAARARSRRLFERLQLGGDLPALQYEGQGSKTSHTVRSASSGWRCALAWGRSGRLAEKLLRHDLIVIDELGYRPFSQSGGQLLFHLISKLYENRSLPITTNLAFPTAMPESPDPPLQHRRDRQHQLAFQEPQLTKPFPEPPPVSPWVHR